MRHASNVCAALLVLLVTLGCDRGGDSSRANTASGTKVTLQLNWKPEPQFGGFYGARVSGAYQRHGLDVEIREGGAGAPTVDMLAAGTVPFAVVSGDEIVVARSLGKPVVALFAVYQTHPQGIMCRASRGFTKLEDIFKNEGTLAIEQGLGYAQFLKQRYGFDKLKIVPSPAGDLSFIRDDERYAMQCFVTSEPLAAKKAGLEVTTFLVADEGYNPYATVLATNEQYLKANRATVEKMVEAVREGWRAYLDDPSRTNETMYRLNPTMDEDTFIAAAEAQRPLIETPETKVRGLGTMSKQRWAELTNQLASLGIVKQAPAPESCFVEVATVAPDAPATNPTSAPAADWTHTLSRDEAYYQTGPQQGRPPEGTFKSGTKVKLLENAGSYSRVTAENGTTAWVASDALTPVR
jgi:NitT/TauT family transport system substrate-binding protein